MRHIQTVQLMKLSFLLRLTRRRFYKEQHIAHRQDHLPFLQKLQIMHCFCTSTKAANFSHLLTQAYVYSSRRTQHAPGSGPSSSQTPRAVKSQPLREKFDSPRAGTLKCVQIYACTWYTHAYIFKKKFSILGKSDPVGRPETRNFFG